MITRLAVINAANIEMNLKSKGILITELTQRNIAYFLSNIKYSNHKRH